MREIKFRAWDKIGRTMLEVITLYFSEEGDLVLLDVSTDSSLGVYQTRPEHIELMQYTGLKDKDGKEIYEGDLVEAGVWGTVGYYNEDTFIVEFDEGAFRGFIVEFSKRKDRFSFSTPLYKLEGVEVIGNIYENPELQRVKE